MKTNDTSYVYWSKILLMLLPFAGAVLFSGTVSAATNLDDYKIPDRVPSPQYNQTNKERVELGKALFFDPRLSGNNATSCGSCHNPALGWSDGLPTAVGDGMQILDRSTPTIINVGFNRFQFWDGRARTLEAQSTGPIMAEGEMNQSMHALLDELQDIEGYQIMFEKAYPGEGITEKTIGKAISAFERTVVSSESAFDRYVKGNRRAISKEAIRGFELFEGKARCVVCHVGYNFTDDGFHNIGLPEKTDDMGRFKILKVSVLKGAFKTPTLKDIGLTPPYMHNGAYKTLEEVVDHYNDGGRNKKHLSPNMQKLNLTKDEKEDLLAFLKTLTGKPKPFTLPVLPQ